MINKLFTDGGARGNPGPSAIGGVLYQDDKLIDSLSEYIGNATNNVAEYKALIEGLKLAIKNNIEDLDCFLDSELVVKQLKREYKVKNEALGKLFVEASNLSLKFKKISFNHVRRELNKEADALVNEALDARK